MELEEEAEEFEYDIDDRPRESFPRRRIKKRSEHLVAVLSLEWMPPPLASPLQIDRILDLSLTRCDAFQPQLKS